MNSDLFSTFNAGELTPLPAVNAFRLSRYPVSLENAFRMGGGKKMARQSQGCELRCVPENGVVFRISSPNQASVQVFQGDFWMQTLELTPGGVQEVIVEPQDRLKRLTAEKAPGLLFSSQVIRLKVQRGTLWLHEVEAFGGEVRPPRPEELPATTWLAWGSSITQADTYGYVHQCAHRLGVDVLNKGLSGSCGVEPEIAAWLAGHTHWDFATLEWGVNLRGHLEPEDFRQRATDSLAPFAETGKPVFLITPFTNDVHLGVGDPETTRRQNAYDDILRELAAQAPDHVRLIEGRDVLRDASSLGADLVHPTHDGHNRMGEELARHLKPCLS
jgi:lysophospholipase L1-like esterase